MPRLSRRSAALRLFARLCGEDAVQAVQGPTGRGEAERQIWDLVDGAYWLYGRSWGPGKFRSDQWQWPFDQLQYAQPFQDELYGSEAGEPWTVLLRRAWELSVAYRVLPR